MVIMIFIILYSMLMYILGYMLFLSMPLAMGELNYKILMMWLFSPICAPIYLAHLYINKGPFI